MTEIPSHPQGKKRLSVRSEAQGFIFWTDLTTAGLGWRWVVWTRNRLKATAGGRNPAGNNPLHGEEHGDRSSSRVPDSQTHRLTDSVAEFPNSRRRSLAHPDPNVQSLGAGVPRDSALSPLITDSPSPRGSTYQPNWRRVLLRTVHFRPSASNGPQCTLPRPELGPITPARTQW